jgi:hypothetical protein
MLADGPCVQEVGERRQAQQAAAAAQREVAGLRAAAGAAARLMAELQAANAELRKQLARGSRGAAGAGGTATAGECCKSLGGLCVPGLYEAPRVKCW